MKKKPVKRATKASTKKTIQKASAKFGTSIVKGKKTALKVFPATAFTPIGKKIPTPPGMAETPGGILVPNKMIQPIPASKLKKGFEKAKAEIKGMIDEVASIITSEYNIKEIELEVSFNADGKFLGFGIGGAASIKIKIAPV